MLTNMLRSVSSLPISRRLIIAFALATLLPSLVIALMGFYYVSQLNERGQIATLTTQAQSNTATISSNLGDISNQAKGLKAVGFTTVGFPNGGQTIPNTPANIDAQVATIHALEQTITQNLNAYNSRYNLIAPNMSQIKSLIDQAYPNDTTATTENNLMGEIVNTAWPDYQAKQETELTQFQQDASQINTLKAAPNTPSKQSNLQTAANTFRTDFRTNSIALDASDAVLTKDWKLIAAYANKFSGYANVAEANINPVLFGSISAVLFIAIVIIFIGFVVQRSITGPLTELVSLTRRISKGDTNARVKIEGRDEISIVANAMNNMLDNIVHLIQDTQSQRDVLQGQVEKLVSEVSGVGEGDLRVQAEVTADALGVLADSFNYMVEELGSLVVRVKMVAREVEESTTVTSDRMSELVEVADRQIQQIAGAALEIEHMALSSQQMANRALGLSSSAREVRLSTQEGRLAVQQTIEGMGRISLNVQETSHKVHNLGESSREINNIVEAISTIAHQTNRLALDAAIQAAMAGDNGKGFGAVAADIRRLAERAKEQATSIGRIVRNVRDEIGAVAVSMRDTERETASGAKLAEEAGTSLESIFTVIERQAREIDVINQMAMQQQQSSNNVVQIMQGVSESTQDSSSSTREAAQNMERIARLAEQLLASVEAFKLREGLNYFTPNAGENRLEEEGVLTMSGAFRTVTATVQPVSNGNNSYIGLPAPNSESGFSQFSPSFPSLGRTNSQPLFQPQGSYNNQQFFSQQEQNNGQQFFPQQEQNNGQQFFPQPGPNNGQQPFSQPRPNNGQQFFPQPGLNNGQQPFSQQEQRNSQPLPPLQRPGNVQQPFPQQGNRMPNESQWPDLDNEPQWSDSNNSWQSGSKNW